MRKDHFVIKFSASLAAALLCATAAGDRALAAPDFTRVDALAGYTPIEVAPGAPGTHELKIAKPGYTLKNPAAMESAQAYSDGLAGLALLVWKNGVLVHEQYGNGASDHTRFETYSMHKSILGLVYGAAIRDGVIHSLDDPSGQYIEEWAHDPRGAITLRQLLTMESGLHFYKYTEPQAKEIASGTDVTQVVLNTPLDRPPGTRFEYNNINSQIAGTLLDRALKRAGRGDYAAYVSRVLLKPIGAGDAHLWLEHPGGEPRFYADFQMGARDWLRVGILIDHHGKFAGRQVLPDTWMDKMSTPSALNPNYGIQIWLGSPWVRFRSYGPDSPIRMSHEKPYIATDLLYFDGFGGERLYVSPSHDLVIVRIGEPSMKFDDSIIPNDVVEAFEAK